MKNRGKLIFSILASLMLACAAIVHIRPQASPARIQSLRQAATTAITPFKKEDLPAFIENRGDGQHTWSVRKSANGETVPHGLIAASQFIHDIPFIVDLNRTAGQPPADVQPLAPILEQDGASPPRLYVTLPEDYTDALDISGQPLRWRIPPNVLAGYTRPKAPWQRKESADSALAPLARGAGSSRYRELVESFARRYNLSAELVMAIIHSESNFSPTLVSHKSAMGLMQLLPSTASDEVHRFLYGHRGSVSFEELRVPETNIRYGTAYLHILLNRYFPGVRNAEVREACAIAAYNLGPNRFLRLYGPTNSQAVEKINSMSVEEFYHDLPGRLPARETRYFVEKVKRMKQRYAAIP